MQRVKLSIDCSGHSASFLLTDGDNKPISDIVFDSSDNLLFKALPNKLTEYHLKISDISDVAWGQGPGSFTGIRICATWLQGVAYVNDIKVIPICSLRARTQQYIEKNNITNGSISTFLSANRLYNYFGQWNIDNGFVLPNHSVTVVKNEELKSTDIDLKEYAATAHGINKLSHLFNNNSEYNMNPFEIRPNYLFDHFN